MNNCTTEEPQPKLLAERLAKSLEKHLSRICCAITKFPCKLIDKISSENVVETSESSQVKAQNKLLVNNYFRQISFDLFSCFSLEESYPFI